LRVMHVRKCPWGKTYGRAIHSALRKHFGNRIPETILEPGRGMVGDAGVIKAEGVLFSRRDSKNCLGGVSLNMGRFGGLAETMEEAIRYPLKTRRDRDETGPCV